MSARAIRDLLQRYVAALDARDPDAVAACFTVDAVYEGSLAGDRIGPALADLATRWQEYERTRHALGCQIVSLGAGGDQAHADTYVDVFQERRRNDGRERRRVVLRYRDDLVRLPDGWRIAARRVRTFFRLDWVPS